MNTRIFSFYRLNLVLFAAALVTAHAQNVTFTVNRNFQTPADRLVRDVEGHPLAGTNYVAQLFYGATPDSLVEVAAAPAHFRIPLGDTLDGTWVGGNRILTGMANGQTVYLQVRVWDSSVASSYSDATENMTGAQYGKSDVFTYVVPYPGSSVLAYYIENFRGFKLVTNPPPNVLVVRENGERVDLLLKGTHTIEGAAAITGPWVSLGSQLPPFTDPNSATAPVRFYRINDGGVYSQNAVGYYRLNICAGYSLIANQLNAPGGNALVNLLKSPPAYTVVFKYDPVVEGFPNLTFLGGAWEGDDLQMALAPGEGAFIYTRTAFTQRFLGEVSHSLSLPIRRGLNLISSVLPQAGPVSLVPPSGLGFPIQEGDQLFQFPCGFFVANSYLFGAWEGDAGGDVPVIGLGESFFLFRLGTGGTWNQTLAVGP